MFGLNLVPFKWWAIGGAALLAAGYIGYLKITVANLRTINATISADRDTYKAASVWNDRTIESLQAREKSVVAALTAELNRVKKQLKSVKIIKEKVAADAPKCVGIPPAGRAISSWVRDTADR